MPYLNMKLSRSCFISQIRLKTQTVRIILIATLSFSPTKQGQFPKFDPKHELWVSDSDTFIFSLKVRSKENIVSLFITVMHTTTHNLTCFMCYGLEEEEHVRVTQDGGHNRILQ